MDPFYSGKSKATNLTFHLRYIWFASASVYIRYVFVGLSGKPASCNTQLDFFVVAISLAFSSI